MNRTAQFFVAAALSAGVLPLCAGADIGHQRPSRELVAYKERIAAGEEKWERDPIAFTAADRRAIRNYYDANTANLPPGLAKRRGDLPPGLRNHLQRNGTLPTGLQQRLAPLAEELERRLHPLDRGYTRGAIGSDLVIVEDRTQRIMDIIRDVTGGL
jgi:hypothetical protein